MTTPAKSEKDRVVIFDTTLRDGEQCPGATMTHEEKLEVAELLDQMGVDIIEAGFPIASEGDFAAVHEIAARARNAVICGLARASFKDIDRCAEAIRPAVRAARGHALLVRAPDALRAAIDVFDPPAAALQAVQAKIKAAHDPAGILSPGRMYAGM